MTDDELEALRRRIGDGPTIRYEGRRGSFVADADRDALLALVDRLRARPKHADEAWLAEFKQRLGKPAVKIMMPDWLAEGVSRLLSHIDASDSAIHDLQQEAGAMLAYEQGAVEGRGRIAGVLEDLKSMASEPHRTIYDFVIRLVRDRVALPDLLPPAACRLALEEANRKVAALRRAIGSVIDETYSEVREAELLRKALEDTA